MEFLISFIDHVRSHLFDKDILFIWSIVVFFAVFQRITFYRQGKFLLLPIALAFLVLRAMDKNAESLLDMITRVVNEHGEVGSRILGDLVGMGILLSLAGLVAQAGFLLFHFSSTYEDVENGLFELAKDWVPSVSREVQKEMVKTKAALRKQLRGSLPFEPFSELPESGISHEELVSLMEEMSADGEEKWREGKVSGAVYHGGEEHSQLMSQTFSFFSLTNPLHPDVWPIQSRMEAEVVSMTANILNGGRASVCGCLTVGGTESIILAVKTHRDWFRKEHGITRGEVICGISAHIAVEKACDLLGLRLVRVPLTEDFKVDVAAMERSISANTIMLYASAPQYPQGAIDDVKAISELGTKYNVGCHVDCCLGGFVLPFMRELGYEVPPFDFALPGVTSMSVDTHKYGYAAKGTSVVLYRDAEIRRHQYFTFPKWPGGLYSTATIPGSRSGGITACAWASLLATGKEGFLRNVKAIVETVRAVEEGIRSIGGFRILGGTQAMIVCFDCEEVNCIKVADRMAKKGWSLNSLKDPLCVHLCVTLRHVGKEGVFLADLRECYEDEQREGKGKASEEGSFAQIYGVTESLPGAPVSELMKTYQDVLLSVD